MGAPKKFTKQMEEEAVRIALEGRSPLQYLEECGSTNPTQKWYEIKQKVKDADPETFAKLPKRIQRKDAVKPVETPEGEYSAADAMEGMQDAADEFFGKCEEMGLKVKDAVKGPVTPDELYETFNKVVEAKDVKAPDEFDGIEVSAIRHKQFGEFYRDLDHNCVDWRTPEGDEMSLSIPAWKDLYEMLPSFFGRLGVDL